MMRRLLIILYNEQHTMGGMSMNSAEKKVREKNLMLLLKIVLREKKARLYLIFALGLVSGISAANTTLFFKLLIDHLQDKPVFIIKVLGSFLLINLLCSLFSKTCTDCWFPRWDVCIEAAIKKEIYHAYYVSKQKDLLTKEYYELYARANREAEVRPKEVLNCLQYTACNLCSAVGVLGVIASMRPVLILLAVVPVGISLYINLRIGEYRVQYQNEITEEERKIKYLMRIFTKPEYFEEVRVRDYSDIFDRYYESAADKIEKSTGKWMGKTARVSSLGANIFSLINYGLPMILLGIWLLAGKISAGEYSTLLLGTANLSTYVFYVMILVPQFKENEALFQSFADFYRREVQEWIPDISRTSVKKVSFQRLELRHVSFTYPNAGEPAVRDISLSVEKGKKIAIVGENGAGKSTLVSLILGIFPPEEGHIRLNGIEYEDWDKERLKSCFAPAFQNYSPLCLSVRDNFTKLTGISAADEEIRDALEKCGLEAMLSSLPKGYDTELGTEFSENGIQFSGGQQQRFAFAQALYLHRDVLILDEPSSSMDVYAQKEFYRTIENECKDKTVIIVTHQLYAAMNADIILFLQNGTVLEQGTHEELMSRGGAYAAMFETQLNHFIEEASYEEKDN